MDIGIFFNPQGRIGPAKFMNAAIILVVVGALFALLPLLGQSGLMLSMISLLLLYPWLVIWVKRFHDADKSGWFFVLVLVLWFVASYAVGLVIAPMMNLPATPQAGADLTAIMESMVEQQRALAVPNAIAGAVVSMLVVVLANMMLKSDPEANPYGPPPNDARA